MQQCPLLVGKHESNLPPLNKDKAMDALKKERLKLIVRNLKSLVAALESEVDSDVNASNN